MAAPYLINGNSYIQMKPHTPPDQTGSPTTYIQ